MGESIRGECMLFLYTLAKKMKDDIKRMEAELTILEKRFKDNEVLILEKLKEEREGIQCQNILKNER